MTMIDKQQALVDELLGKLKAVPNFGQHVFEDSTMRVIDENDTSLPDYFIVLQTGQTDEVERVGSKSLRERVVLNITLVTRKRDYAAELRTGRLHVKKLLAGRNAGLIQSQSASFLAESPIQPASGNVFAAHVMPLQITYVQNY